MGKQLTNPIAAADRASLASTTAQGACPLTRADIQLIPVRYAYAVDGAVTRQAHSLHHLFTVIFPANKHAALFRGQLSGREKQIDMPTARHHDSRCIGDSCTLILRGFITLP